MNQSNQHQISVAGTTSVAVDNESLPKIFKLRVDIFYQIFDYMSLEDILAMAHTCKVMQKVAGFYFQQNFPDTFQMTRDSENPTVVYVNGIDTSRDGFEEFISSLIIKLPARRVLKTESFLSVKYLKLDGQLDDVQLRYVKNILSNVKILDLRNLNCIDDRLYYQLLSYCTGLKCLRIRRTSFISSRIEIIHDWLRRKATLELIDFGENKTFVRECNQLKILLEKNSSLKQVMINCNDFWVNRNLFAEAKIQLDCLILLCHDNLWIDFPFSRQFADLLTELNARGFFKKLILRIYTKEYTQEFINQVGSMSALQGISLYYYIPQLDLSRLVHLKQLEMYMSEVKSMNTDNLGGSLVNLEKLFLSGLISTDVIIPFLRNSRKLNVVKVNRLPCGDLSKDDILDIAALNQLRQNLNGARKVSIYVDEEVYLATKWATKNEEFSLVEIKRTESIKYDFNDSFCHKLKATVT